MGRARGALGKEVEIWQILGDTALGRDITDAMA